LVFSKTFYTQTFQKVRVNPTLNTRFSLTAGRQWVGRGGKQNLPKQGPYVWRCLLPIRCTVTTETLPFKEKIKIDYSFIKHPPQYTEADLTKIYGI